MADSEDIMTNLEDILTDSKDIMSDSEDVMTVRRYCWDDLQDIVID